MHACVALSSPNGNAKCATWPRPTATPATSGQCQRKRGDAAQRTTFCTQRLPLMARSLSATASRRSSSWNGPALMDSFGPPPAGSYRDSMRPRLRTSAARRGGASGADLPRTEALKALRGMRNVVKPSSSGDTVSIIHARSRCLRESEAYCWST